MNIRNILTRKNGIIALVVLVVGVAAWFLWGMVVSYLSQRDVTFTLADGVSSMVVTNNDAATSCTSNCPALITETLTASGKVRLPDGTYSITPSGDAIVTDRISITVTKETTSFTIEPDYSDEHLSSLYSKEASAIIGALKAEYTGTSAYSIGEGKLYKHGEWCIVPLTPDTDGSVDIYSAVLQKVSGTWRVAIAPALHFSYSENPSIPKDVLYQANAGVF